MKGFLEQRGMVWETQRGVICFFIKYHCLVEYIDFFPVDLIMFYIL